MLDKNVICVWNRWFDRPAVGRLVWV